jgi:hypothetical protein
MRSDDLGTSTPLHRQDAFGEEEFMCRLPLLSTVTVTRAWTTRVRRRTATRAEARHMLLEKFKVSVNIILFKSAVKAPVETTWKPN